MRDIIYKSDKRTKYSLFNFYIKVDQGFKLVINREKFIKRLRFKIKPISIFINYYFNISIINQKSLKL